MKRYAIVLLIFVAGCRQSPVRTLVLTLKDKEQRDVYFLERGDSLEIKLNPDPSTGAEWVVTSKMEPIFTLKPRATDAKAGEEKKGKQEAPVVEYLATARGETVVVVELKAPGKEAPQDVLKVKIEVK